MINTLQIDISHYPRSHTWTFRAALSRWGVGVGAVELWASLSLTLDSPMLRRWWRYRLVVKVRRWVCVCERRHTHQAGADMAWLIRSRKPLSVAIDTMVISAAITHVTAGTSWKETDIAGWVQTVCIRKKTISRGHIHGHTDTKTYL